MRFILAVTAVTALLCSMSRPVDADNDGLITSRRILGATFLGGGVLLAQNGFNLRDEADDFYAAYERANDPVQIERLYQRTTNRDVKSQVSWALAAAFGVTGVRLLLVGPPDSSNNSQQVAAASSPTSGWRQSLRLLSAMTPGHLSVRLERPFY